MYNVVTAPLPTTDTDIQKAINTIVPPGSKLISVSVYLDGSNLKMLIVFA